MPLDHETSKTGEFFEGEPSASGPPEYEHIEDAMRKFISERPGMEAPLLTRELFKDDPGIITAYVSYVKKKHHLP